MTIKTIATNRKAHHNYIILETLETGIVLTGSEIKSIRAGHVTLSDAYVRPENDEMWLVNAHIARYDPSSIMSHEPTRRRKLLLHRKQISNLSSQVAEKGLTLVPLRLYIKGGLAKLEIGLARGKKLYDKREAIAEREMDRTLDRTLKTRKTFVR